MHARHPQALVERGPVSGTLTIQQQVRRKLFSVTRFKTIPHASHLRSSLLRLVRTTPDHARMPRALQACLQRSRMKQAQELPYCSRPDVWVIPLETAAKHGVLLLTQHSPHDRELVPKCCAEANDRGHYSPSRSPALVSVVDSLSTRCISSFSAGCTRAT